MTSLPVIAIIQASDPAAFGGEEIQTIALVEGLREKFDFILVVAGEGPFSKEARSEGIEVKVVPMREMGTSSAIIALSSFLKEKQAKIVHTLDIRSNFLGRLAAKRARVPAVVATRHEMYYSAGFDFGKKVRRFLYLLLDRLTAHFCDLFIVVSRAIEQELIRWERIPPRKIKLIYNGIDLREMDRRASVLPRDEVANRLGLDESHLVVGSVGRLISEKGYETLVLAARAIVRSFPKVCFLLVGKGSDRQRLQELVEEFGLEDRFRFLGFQEEPLRFVNLFDVFVLPSIHEGFGLTVLEAMAFQKPVVATRVGGIPEIVADGESGILVPPRNPEALAEAILTLLKNRTKATEMGKCGRKIVEKSFRLEDMLQRTEKVYDKLLEKKPV